MQSQHNDTMMPWDPPSYQSHSFERPHQALAAYEAASPPNIVSQSDNEFLHLATDWIPGASSTVQPRTQILQVSHDVNSNGERNLQIRAETRRDTEARCKRFTSNSVPIHTSVQFRSSFLQHS
ncbi:hypothetical protein IG631_04234 [Alternaria alternata]|nr:hypothetical protein IG631_04234 [Alternaria alternata]